MRVEEELIDFLQQYLRTRRSRHRQDTIARDIEIIASYYGFREAKWPTQGETFTRFKVGEVNTRERIHQLVDEFRCTAPLSDLPAMVKCAHILSQHSAICIRDYVKLINEAGLIDESCNIRGLLNYLQDFGFYLNYDIYSPYVQRITCGKVEGYEEKFLFTQDKVTETIINYRKARVLPGCSEIERVDPYIVMPVCVLDAIFYMKRM